MNILSIDVGIKNLAYCLFHIKNEDLYEIKDWNIINLCKNNNCLEMTKNKKICNKKAKLYKNNKFYCKVHAKKSNYLIPTEELRYIHKTKLVKLRSLCQKYNLEYNKKSKKGEIVTILTEYIHKNYLDFVNIKNTKNISMIKIGRLLKIELDHLFENIDCFIIESQIGPLANRMKMLEGMILQHFIEKKCKNIVQVPPCNKLKDFQNGAKLNYKEKKNLGIKSCLNIIQTNPFFIKWIDFYNKSKKKDDLADSFLQGWWYLKYCVQLKI